MGNMINILTRSNYSLMNSSLRVEDIVAHGVNQRQTHVALVENDRLFSSALFLKCCQTHNVTPIIGVTLNCVINEHQVKISFVAKNTQGFYAIAKLSTLASQNKDKINIEHISIDSNVFVFVHIDHSWFEESVIQMREVEVSSALAVLSSTFHHFMVVLTHFHIEFWKIRNTWMLQTFKDKVAFIPSLHIAFKSNDDAIVLSTLRAIALNRKVDDPLNVINGDTFLRDRDELLLLFPNQLHEALTQIVNAIEPIVLSHITSLPSPQLPIKATPDQYLISLCQKGLEKRSKGKIEHHYQQRLNFELDVIIKMGFENYFLLIWDIIRFAKSQAIPVGPGRGSAAGSLVSYCLGITHVDPLQYGLLFERFLNPERISMPDIDIDFADNRRDEIIHYVHRTYGDEHVAQIVTFGTFGAKMALRDVAKAFDIQGKEIDSWTKLIPNELKMNLHKAIQSSKQLQEIYEHHPRFRKIFGIAQAIEGCPRHISKHAAGVVMSSLPLSNILPMVKVDDGLLSTQFSMEYLEPLGLIKMDFLGLKNLTIIQDTLDLISNPPAMHAIPLDDSATFQLISRGDTAGIFQLESEGMTNLIVKMKPTSFDDIVATIALFRPGPMENIPLYLKARETKAKLDHLPQQMHAIVASTYGILIYQEQIIQTVQTLAHFTPGKADILRKAMSKKNEHILNQLKDDFIQGCLNNKLSHNQAMQMFDLIAKFANYGFNKSHSVAYGLISYHMAYLKTHFPLPFYTALLNGVLGSETKTIEYIHKIRNLGFQIHHVSLNHSTHKYLIAQSGVRLPFTLVKGIGSAIVSLILQERNFRGSFKDYYDAIARLSLIKVGTKTIENLILVGAFDEFDTNRASLLASLDDALNYANLIKIETHGQSTLDTSILSIPRYTVVNYDSSLYIEKEKQLIGFYVSHHPIVQWKQRLGFTSTLNTITASFSGIVHIDTIKSIKTKRGENMAFLSLTDETTQREAILWPSEFQQFGWIKEKMMVIVHGKVDLKGVFIIKLIQEITEV